MSPRAAWRLETLGFEQTYDYVGGKADWVANGLRLDGTERPVYAGDLAQRDPPTCALDTSVAGVQAELERSRAGFCIVVTDQRIVLGRVRRAAIRDASPDASAESLMEPGPSTVRYDVMAADLVRRLSDRDLLTAIITTPAGRLVGVFHRADAEARLRVG